MDRRVLRFGFAVGNGNSSIGQSRHAHQNAYNDQTDQKRPHVSTPLVRASARTFALFTQSLCEPGHRSPRMFQTLAAGLHCAISSRPSAPGGKLGSAVDLPNVRYWRLVDICLRVRFRR
jgi:hypothetical protein